MNNALKRIFLWLIAAIILVSVFNIFGPQVPETKINYSDFINEMNKGNIKSVSISGENVVGVLNDGKSFSTRLLQPLTDDSPLVKTMLDKKIVIKSTGDTSRNGSLLVHLINMLPWILLLAFWLYFVRKQRNNDRK